jgi:hypothetical protein
MRRTSLAALLAAPVLLAFAGIAHAHPPKQCFAPFGGGGICVGIFSKLHQHGPLFNYGPYYGYPPFEPYGPWDSYLRWTAGYGGYGYGHGHGHGHGHAYQDYSGRGGICTGGHAGGYIGHGAWKHGGWFHGGGHSGLFHGHKSWGDCSDGACTPTAYSPVTTDPLTRYSGAGAPENSAIFYTGLPTIDPASLAPASGYRR